MCWIQEWARAINNLNHAITHVEYGKKKLEGRLARNYKNLQRLKSNPKYNYPTFLEPVEELIRKNTRAIIECKQLIADFKARQDNLYGMINTYGIRRFENSKMIKKAMGTYVPKEASP